MQFVFLPVFGGAPFAAVPFAGAFAIASITPIPTGPPIGVGGIVLPDFATVS